MLRRYYNFIRPHTALEFGQLVKTPAMQAGLTDAPLTFRPVFLSALSAGINRVVLRRVWGWHYRLEA